MSGCGEPSSGDTANNPSAAGMQQSARPPFSRARAQPLRGVHVEKQLSCDHAVEGERLQYAEHDCKGEQRPPEMPASEGRRVLGLHAILELRNRIAMRLQGKALVHRHLDVLFRPTPSRRDWQMIDV